MMLSSKVLPYRQTHTHTYKTIELLCLRYDANSVRHGQWSYRQTYRQTNRIIELLSLKYDANVV